LAQKIKRDENMDRSEIIDSVELWLNTQEAEGTTEYYADDNLDSLTILIEE